MPRSRKRKQVRERQASAAHVAQQKAESKKLTPEQYTRRRVIGWSLAGLAVTMFVTHWLAHVGVLYRATGTTDLLIGYPMAMFFGIASAMVLGR